jgi:hypothetical protein
MPAMNIKNPNGFTYWSDLGVQLNDLEHTDTQWVHALPVGQYNHPMYGKLSFTRDRIRRFAQSIKDKVRGIDPDIDYDHKLDPSKGNAAAGWVRDAEERDDGLWLLVEWTKKAVQAIKDKEYRYFSAEFVDEWEDAQGNKFKDVVLGGGLTNRPFIKNLVPINLSEVMGNNQEDVMDRVELARILGLGEDATEDDIKTKLNELASQGNSKVDLAKLSVKEEDGVLTFSHEDAEGSYTYELPKDENNQSEAELAKLAETNPVIARLLSEREADRKRLDNLETATRLSEVSTQLSEVGREAKTVLPPVVQDKLRSVMVRLPKALSDEIAGAMGELAKVGGLVKLGETAPSGKPNGEKGGEDVVNKFLSEVDAKLASNKELNYREAVDLVRTENPVLFQEYNNAIVDGDVITLEEES